MMSNNHHQPKNKSERKPSENPSSKVSTASSEVEKPQEQEKVTDANLLQALLTALQPALNMINEQSAFHKTLAGAHRTDLRIMWDVRVIRGADVPVAHLAGTSQLPGAFSTKMRHSAAAMIQQEIIDKIATPMTARVMEEEERLERDEAEVMTPQTAEVVQPMLESSGFEDIQQMALTAARQEESAGAVLVAKQEEES